MRKYFLILICLLLLGCRAREEAPSINNNSDKKQSLQYFDLSFIMPAGWSIVEENERFLVLAPMDELSWEPVSPEDIANNPQVRFDRGENIREILRPDNFPDTINEADLLDWLKEQTARGVFRDLDEKRIANHLAIAVTEVRPPDCERVVYWRMDSMEDLIRLATGCESPYLSDFYRIVDSLQE
jgi:hypothetical protein